ncbi:MAG: GNAT family N-acetyltransferase [Methyloligellaceae bacterium]
MSYRETQRLREIAIQAIEGIREYYSDEQKLAWKSSFLNFSEWSESLSRQTVFTGKRKNSVVGFMSLTGAGLIDYAFIHPDFQGQGLFREIFEELENFALKERMPVLVTNASLIAEPAFKGVGFEAIEEQRVERSGIHLNRIKMEKTIIKN